MPRSLTPWLEEVVRYNMSRPVVRMSRVRRVHSLRERIESFYSVGRTAIIAEYKRRSPSGFYCDRDPLDYVKHVEKLCVGVSVLTEELFFGGSYIDLLKIASIIDVPVLMKDIVVDYKQIETAYNIGADAILLIASILTDKELENLYEVAKGYKLEALVEVHTAEEAENMVSMGYPMIGVNSRDLKTLKVDLLHAYQVLKKIPSRFTKVAESGIKSRRDVELLREAGAKAYLIGTELMLNPSKIYDLVWKV